MKHESKPTQMEIMNKLISQLLAGVRKRAPKTRLECALDRRDVEALVRRANGCCEVTGVPFREKPANMRTRNPWGPSIDRIDSMRGYVLANCRLVCVVANLAMNEWGEKPLWEIATAMARRQLLFPRSPFRPCLTSREAAELCGEKVTISALRTMVRIGIAPRPYWVQEHPGQAPVERWDANEMAQWIGSSGFEEAKKLGVKVLDGYILR